MHGHRNNIKFPYVHELFLYNIQHIFNTILSICISLNSLILLVLFSASAWIMCHWFLCCGS